MHASNGGRAATHLDLFGALGKGSHFPAFYGLATNFAVF